MSTPSIFPGKFHKTRTSQGIYLGRYRKGFRILVTTHSGQQHFFKEVDDAVAFCMEAAVLAVWEITNAGHLERVEVPE